MSRLEGVRVLLNKQNKYIRKEINKTAKEKANLVEDFMQMYLDSLISMSSNSRGLMLKLCIAVSLLEQVTANIVRTESTNVATGFVFNINSSDIVMGHTFLTENTRGLYDCTGLCLQTNSCVSVYYVTATRTCNLNSNYIPQFVMASNYTPDVTDLLGWDSKGLVCKSIKKQNIFFGGGGTHPTK